MPVLVDHVQQVRYYHHAVWDCLRLGSPQQMGSEEWSEYVLVRTGEVSEGMNWADSSGNSTNSQEWPHSRESNLVLELYQTQELCWAPTRELIRSWGSTKAQAWTWALC